ncbi:MAG: YjfB family protein [Lachnospirales bacterium]
MDIASLSMAVSQVNISQQASISVLKNAMDTAVQQSGELMEMMETVSVDPNSAGLLDVAV